MKRARSVRNKANAHYEERGIETLYLACGMVTWSAHKSGATPAAPVLLVPCRLAPKGAAEEEFELTVTGELEVNPTLLQMLKAEFGVSCEPAELLDSAGIQGIIDTPDELDVSFDWLRRHCASVPGFKISERFVIGNFSYARMPMVRDLETSLEAMADHDIVAALAGDADAQAALRQKGAAGRIPTPDFVPPADEFLVLDADASQNYVVNAVLAGKNLIIKGPPGTGKSQTISNLIATLVARGKRVLFVAEKRAAIDAVLRRLNHVGLGDLVLDLHGGVSSKRKVAEALNEALARNGNLVKPRVEGLPLGERDKIVERWRVCKREIHLVADDRPSERSIGFLPSRKRIIRDTGCADVATVEQAAHSRHDHRIGHHRVGLVNLVERNSLQLQPPRTGTLSLLDHRGERRDWEDLADYSNLGALVAESLPENALALARAIYFGRIEQRHPRVCGRAARCCVQYPRRNRLRSPIRVSRTARCPDRSDLTRPIPPTSRYLIYPTVPAPIHRQPLASDHRCETPSTPSA